MTLTQMEAMKSKREQADEVDMMIGAKIRRRRLELGMSRQQLAQAIGVTHQQTRKYEEGLNRISAARLRKVAQALERPVSFFFEGIDDENNDSDELTVPSQHQRLCIEVSRNFMRIRNADYQVAVNALVRSLASEQ